MFTPEEFSKMIDHTQLKPFATKADIKKLCDEAIKYGFMAVCVNPYWVSYAASLLKDTEIKVAATIGFPLGATVSSIKAAEARSAVEAGADELDMVINIGALKDGDDDLVRADVKAVVEAAQEAGRSVGKDKIVVKAIIETCYLNTEEKARASKLVVEAGADYVKTSTGFGERGVTGGDIYAIKAAVGNMAKIKAAGGIRSFSFAKELIEIGVDRLGTSSSVALLDEMKFKYF